MYGLRKKGCGLVRKNALDVCTREEAGVDRGRRNRLNVCTREEAGAKRSNVSPYFPDRCVHKFERLEVSQ